MYQKSDKTAEFSWFEMTILGEFGSDNQWVVLAELMPWNEAVNRYVAYLHEGNRGPAP